MLLVASSAPMIMWEDWAGKAGKKYPDREHGFLSTFAFIYLYLLKCIWNFNYWVNYNQHSLNCAKITSFIWFIASIVGVYH